MAYEYLHALPLSLFILIPVTFVITYTLAVKWDHVMPLWPYISETGSSSPESCIFGQLLNIAALLLACCIYIRHRQVEQWRRERGENSVHRRVVLLTVWSGLLSCFGLDILANFQSANVITVHMVGALTCFFSGTLYFCLQAYLTKKMTTAVNGSIFVWVRSSLAGLSVILTIVLIIPGQISVQEFRGQDYKRWKPDDGGWEWHATSALAEWILAIVYCVYLLTFVSEFRFIHIETPEVTLIYLDKKQYDLKLSQLQETMVEEV